MLSRLTSNSVCRTVLAVRTVRSLSSRVGHFSCPARLPCPTTCRDQTALSTRMIECKDTGCVDCPRQGFDSVDHEIIRTLVHLIDWQMSLPPRLRMNDDPISIFEAELVHFVKVAQPCIKVLGVGSTLTNESLRLGAMLSNVCDLMSRIALSSSRTLPDTCKLCLVDMTVDLLAGIVPTLNVSVLGSSPVLSSTSVADELLKTPDLSIEMMFSFVVRQLLSYREWLVCKMV